MRVALEKDADRVRVVKKQAPFRHLVRCSFHQVAPPPPWLTLPPPGRFEYRYCYVDPFAQRFVWLGLDPHNFSHPTGRVLKQPRGTDEYGNRK